MKKYCKIIIIDDEFIIRQGIKYMLDWEKEGFQIVGEAKDGKEGLELIESVKPDIVLLDMVMPILDGMGFSKIVQERYPDVQFIILSGHDKFEYVKTVLLNGAVDYILKPTMNPKDLLQALHKAVKKIPGMQLEKSDEISVETQLEKMILGYQKQLENTKDAEMFPYGNFTLLGINLRQMCENKKESMASVEELIKEYFTKDGTYRAVAVLMKHDILCYVFNYRLKEEEDLEHDIVACMNRISQIKPKAFAVRSPMFTNLEDIKTYYDETIVPQLGLKFYYAKCSYIHSQQLSKEKQERFAFEKFSDYLRMGQLQMALDMFLCYVQEMCAKKVDEFRVKNVAKNLLYNFFIDAERQGITDAEFQEKVLNEIDASEDVEAFLQTMERLRDYMHHLWNSEEGLQTKKIGEMRSYISNHYNENLSLAMLADKFGFSYHYLSYYFNKQAKEGFSEYLNKIRIQKACELLKEETYTISQISGEIGYSDHAYFCRVFKKMVGETPSNYRKNQRNGDW